MIKFQFDSENDTVRSFVDLVDHIRANPEDKYPDTHVGPFDDLSLLYLRISNDGKAEKKLADNFEKFLKHKNRPFRRADLMKRFYEDKSF